MSRETRSMRQAGWCLLFVVLLVAMAASVRAQENKPKKFLTLHSVKHFLQK